MVLATSGLRDAAGASNDIAVYDDALGSSWENWSWASVDLTSTAVVRSGTTSIAVTASAWSALSLRHVPFDSTPFGNLTFWINGGQVGGQRLRVFATLGDAGQQFGVDIPALAPATWQQVSIPLGSLGAANTANFTGFWIQEFTGSDQTTFYVDDIAVSRSVAVTPPPPLEHGMALYDDVFAEGWQNWSWANIDSANTSQVSTGASALAVRAGPFTALAFHHAAMDTGLFGNLTFWINPGDRGGQILTIRALLSGVLIEPGVTLPPLAVDPNRAWTKVSIPLSALGVAKKTDLTDVWVMETSGNDHSANPFYVDDVRLDLAPPPARVNVTVDGDRERRAVDPRLFGLNAAIWDGAFNTPTTQALLEEAGYQALRFPGGSASDEYHWQTNQSEGQTFQWATGTDAFAGIATATKARVFITANYGTGTPEEAAAWVRYANRTKNYDFKYWEIGNENYGTWETDRNTRPHDPVTYATRFKDYVAQMKAVDRSIKIGAVVVVDEDSFANYPDQSAVNPRTGATHPGWNAVMLSTLARLGVTPDYVVYHRYEQGPGGESDSFLLSSTRTWANDAASIRQILNDYLGTNAKRVEIICTENNSVFSNPGKQSTSLVNGLFMADSIGNILQTEFNGLFWWDLRNGPGVANNNPNLYGWRQFGDYGIVNANVPAGPVDRYPSFYVKKLLTRFAQGGERVVTAASDFSGVGVYAVRDRRDHTLNLLLINKHPTAALPVRIAVRDFNVARRAEVFTYGIPQDEAARTGTGSADVARSTAAISGSTFTWTPGPYSATVIRLEQADRHRDDDRDDDRHDRR
jgi:alpha-L-arabinofuranosidase